MTNEVATRGTILALEAAMVGLDPTFDAPVTNHFAPGLYGREIFMAAGNCVVGKIHKHAHLNVLIEGHVVVVTEEGREEFHAPRVWVSTPGTKRAVHCITNTRWLTCHPTEETDLEKIEAEVIAPDYGTLDHFLLE